MNFKQHKSLIIAGACILVLLAGSLFLLHSAWTRYNKTKTELQSLIRSQAKLKSRDPFPSRKNVESEQEKLSDAALAAVRLNNALRTGQVEPQKMESAEFMPLLERTLGALSEKFKTAEIKTPDGFLFGFDRYAKSGTLPDDEHIPKLVQQLRIMEQLCDILVKADITELQSLKRAEFETSAAGAGAPATGRAAARTARTAPGPDSRRSASPQSMAQELYPPPLHFSMAFRSRESAVFNVINKLASDSMFCVITNIELANERSGVPTPEPERVQFAEGAVRDVIIGRERVLTKIEIDVYRFNQLWNKLEGLTGISVPELQKQVAEQAAAEQAAVEQAAAEQVAAEEAAAEQADEEPATEEQVDEEQVVEEAVSPESGNDSGTDSPVSTVEPVEIEEQ